MNVGTAGHIDHGKTTLVRALTGVDTDRLAAEKARGITIELGFAYADLGAPERPGAITGFVDVPGHERFVHTMLAGAGGMIFSVDSYPGPLQTLVELTPSAALGDALRAALIEQGPAWPQWAVLAAWAVLAGLCARRFFRWS